MSIIVGITEGDTREEILASYPQMSQTCRRLVVLHQGAMGDFVLALGVVQAVRAWLESAGGPADVQAVAAAPSARLAAGRSAVDACLSPEVVGLHSLFRDEGQLDPRLAELLCGASLILSFLGSRHEPIHGRLVRAAGGQVVSIDPRPTAATLEARRHITQQWVESAQQGGLPIADALVPVIERPARGGSEGTRDMPAGEPAGARVIIHPGSGGREKCWPVERFVELAEKLGVAGVTWLLGPAELEPGRFEAGPIRQRAAAGADAVLTAWETEDAADAIAGADLYVGNDAGMTHVAAALGVRTVVVFGPTDPRVWRPLGTCVRTIAPAVPGPINEIQVREVLAAAESPTWSAGAF